MKKHEKCQWHFFHEPFTSHRSLSLTPHTSNFPFESFSLSLSLSLFVSRPRGIFLCKWCRMDEWCKMNWNWLSLYRVESRSMPRGKLNVLGVLFVMLSLPLSLCVYILYLFIIRFLISLTVSEKCSHSIWHYFEGLYTNVHKVLSFCQLPQV